MGPFGLCFGVEFLCCLNLMYVFIYRVNERPPIGKYTRLTICFLSIGT